MLQTYWQSCTTLQTDWQSCAILQTHQRSCAMCPQCQQCPNITEDNSKHRNQYQNINQDVFIPTNVKFHHWLKYNIVTLLTLQTHWQSCATSQTHWQSCATLRTHRQSCAMLPTHWQCSNLMVVEIFLL